MSSSTWNGYGQKNGYQKRKYKSQEELAEQAQYDELKAKYANAVVYLLISGVTQSGLRSYFGDGDQNKRRYDTIKRLRYSMIDSRPKAKHWVDKSFYIGLKVGGAETDGLGVRTVQIIHGDTLFKQRTSVVGSTNELDRYLASIAKIIDSEKIWSDPDMVDFDIGERDDGAQKIEKKPKQYAAKREKQYEESGATGAIDEEQKQVWPIIEEDIEESFEQTLDNCTDSNVGALELNTSQYQPNDGTIGDGDISESRNDQYQLLGKRYRGNGNIDTTTYPRLTRARTRFGF